MRFEENEETNEVTEKSIPVTKEVKEEFISFLEKVSWQLYTSTKGFKKSNVAKVKMYMVK